MDQDKPDFDDLFEPFELGEAPTEPETPRRQPQPRQETTDGQEIVAPSAAEPPPVPKVACPSCGAQNPDYNRHF